MLKFRVAAPKVAAPKVAAPKVLLLVKLPIVITFGPEEDRKKHTTEMSVNQDNIRSYKSELTELALSWLLKQPENKGKIILPEDIIEMTLNGANLLDVLDSRDPGALTPILEGSNKLHIVFTSKYTSPDVQRERQDNEIKRQAAKKIKDLLAIQYSSNDFSLITQASEHTKVLDRNAQEILDDAQNKMDKISEIATRLTRSFQSALTIFSKIQGHREMLARIKEEIERVLSRLKTLDEEKQSQLQILKRIKDSLTGATVDRMLASGGLPEILQTTKDVEEIQQGIKTIQTSINALMDSFLKEKFGDSNALATINRLWDHYNARFSQEGNVRNLLQSLEQERTDFISKAKEKDAAVIQEKAALALTIQTEINTTEWYIQAIKTSHKRIQDYIANITRFKPDLNNTAVIIDAKNTAAATEEIASEIERRLGLEGKTLEAAKTDAKTVIDAYKRIQVPESKIKATYETTKNAYYAQKSEEFKTTFLQEHAVAFQRDKSGLFCFFTSCFRRTNLDDAKKANIVTILEHALHKENGKLERNRSFKVCVDLYWISDKGEIINPDLRAIWDNTPKTTLPNAPSARK